MAKPISRRDFLRLAAVGATGYALSACAKKAEPTPTQPAATPTPKEPVTISYWHIWGGVRTEQLQQPIDDFMEENPEITVEPLLLPNPGFRDKIVTGLAGDAPDLTMIYTDQFAPSAKRGALKQVDELMSADGLSSDIWYPGVWKMNVWDGKAYGIPFVGNFLNMMYWVKDDMEDAGLDPETIGETFDELLDTAEALTTFDDKGNVEHLGVQGVGGWMGCSYRNGVQPYGDGTPEGVDIDNPRCLAALEYTRDVIVRQGGYDAVTAATEAWGNQQLGNPMIAGVCTILNSGVFTINIINEQKPDLNYKIGFTPHGPDGGFLDVVVASWANVIPTKGQHPEEAWVLAKYLSAGDGHLKFMVELQGRPAMVKAFNEAPHDAKAREKNPYWDTVLEILNGEQATYPVSDKLGAANSVVSEAWDAMILEERTPEETVAWAQTEVEKVFAEE